MTRKRVRGAPDAVAFAVRGSQLLEEIKDSSFREMSQGEGNAATTFVLAKEYGFWANVNPAVPHPRWSQATERSLTTYAHIDGSSFSAAAAPRLATQLYNGYGDYVRYMYNQSGNERLFV